MIPLKLRLHNFISYRGTSPDFDFTGIHIAVLSGDNGAGKSSFLEAIHWAIWGEARLRDAEIIHIGETQMYVEFEFAINNAYYRIHRSFSAAGRQGGKLELYQATDATRSSWASLTKATKSETQQFITEQVVGMSYAVFANSAYLRQGQADAFTKLTPAERREILAKILEIDVYESYRERVKTQRMTLAAQEVALKNQMQNDETTAATIPELNKQLTEAEARHANALIFLQYAETQIAIQQTRVSLSTALQHQHHQEGTRTQLIADIARIDETLAQRATIEAQYQRLTSLEQEARQLRTQRDTYNTLSQQRLDAQTDIDRQAQALTLQIATLTQTIHILSDSATQRAEIDVQLADIDATLAQNADGAALLTEMKQQQHAFQIDINAHQSALQRMKSIHDERTRVQQRIAELTHTIAPLSELNEKIAASEQAQVRQTVLNQQRTAQQQELTATETQRNLVRQRGVDMQEKKKLLTINEPCPTCQTMMDEAHFSMAVAEFETEITQLRQQYTTLNTTCKEVASALTTIDAEIAACGQLVAQIGKLRGMLGVIEAAQKELQSAETRLTTLSSEYDALVSADHQKQLSDVQHQLDALNTRFQAALTHQGQFQALTQQQTQLRTQRARLDEQLAQKAHAEQQLTTAERDLAQQTFAADARTLLSDIDAQLAALAYDPQVDRGIQQQIDELADVRTQYNELAVLTERRDALIQRRDDTLQSLQQLSDTIHTLEHEQTQLRTKSTDLEPLLSGRDLTQQAQQLKQHAEIEIRSRHDHVTQLTFKLAAATEADVRVSAQREQLATLAVDQQRHVFLEKAFSGKGIQAMIIREHAVPALEDEANRILSQMSDNQLSLQISTNETTQAGSLRETVEIKVSDATGTRAIEAFSGGEAFRISFALRIALSKIMHKRAGHPLETLIIDEGFGTQDANGRERLVEAINSISNEFRTILVITHIQELRDLFPVQIAFRRSNGTSSWEIIA